MNNDRCIRMNELEARPKCEKHCGLVNCLGADTRAAAFGPIVQPVLRAGAADRLHGIVSEPTHALRSLRVWHYRHALQASQRQHDKRASHHTLALARQAWVFHMGAVQALNDLFPSGDDVDSDHARMTQADEVLPFKVPA